MVETFNLMKVMKTPLINISSHGVETARYNSLLHLPNMHHEHEFALYSCGNRLVLFNMDL